MPTKMKSSPILALLKKDHEQVQSLLDTLEKTSKTNEGGTRSEVFAQLADEIRKHSRGEEEVLYPKLENIEETKSMALEAIEEHRVVDELITKIESIPPEEDSWGPTFKVLKENLEHHIQEEEGEMFPRITNLFDASQLIELGREFADVKAKTSTPQRKAS